MQIYIEDKRLRPILEKVQADVRLDAEDGVALFKSSGHSRPRLPGQPSSQSANTATSLWFNVKSGTSIRNRCLRGELQTVRLREAR